MTTETRTSPTLHIRYDGESLPVSLNELDLGDLASDADIKRVAATYLDVPASKFNSYHVDRNTDTGDITLRPAAVFG